MRREGLRLEGWGGVLVGVFVEEREGKGFGAGTEGGEWIDSRRVVWEGDQGLEGCKVL